MEGIYAWLIMHEITQNSRGSMSQLKREKRYKSSHYTRLLDISKRKTLLEGMLFIRDLIFNHYELPHLSLEHYISTET